MRPASMLIQRRIEWPDTDAAGHYHFLTVFRLFEAAEAALHRRLGIVDETFGRTPRVHVEADYHMVLHFQDLVDVEIRVSSLGRTSITYAFQVRQGTSVAAEGRVISVLLDQAEGERLPWPDHHRKLLLEGGPQEPETMSA
jgi:acyl-CoA thioesterase FadM